MLLMNIRQIKKTGDDYSLSVPLSILPGLNADWISNIRIGNVVTHLRKQGERLTSGVYDFNSYANGRSNMYKIAS